MTKVGIKDWLRRIAYNREICCFYLKPEAAPDDQKVPPDAKWLDGDVYSTATWWREYPTKDDIGRPVFWVDQREDYENQGLHWTSRGTYLGVFVGFNVINGATEALIQQVRMGVYHVH